MYGNGSHLTLIPSPPTAILQSLLSGHPKVFTPRKRTCYPPHDYIRSIRLRQSTRWGAWEHGDSERWNPIKYAHHPQNTGSYVFMGYTQLRRPGRWTSQWKLLITRASSVGCHRWCVANLSTAWQSGYWGIDSIWVSQFHLIWISLVKVRVLDLAWETPDAISSSVDTSLSHYRNPSPITQYIRY